MIMFDFIRTRLRKKNLLKALTPAPVEENQVQEEQEAVESKEVKSVIVLIDVAELTWKDIRTRALEVFAQRGLSGQVSFIFNEKIDKKTILTTPPDQTITLSDMGWSGKPVTDKIPELVSQKPDVLINLVKDSDFLMEYIVKVSEARYKVGMKEFATQGYDMLFEDTEETPLSPLESFNAIIDYLDRMEWKVL